MGRKVHPMGFRIGIIRDWQAKWYADKHYAEFLQEDLKLRAGINSRYAEAAVSLVEIERAANKVSITIHTARPGIVIGRGGQRVDETRTYLEKLIGKRVQLNIQEVQRPELDAFLVAKSIAEQIERRVAYRRAMKQTTLRTIQAGAQGMRVSCSGRLGGAEIARRLTMAEGQVPLHTLRADIDYGFIEARTAMGRIGVKVWIYKGDILPERKEDEGDEITMEPLVEAAAADVAKEASAAPVAQAAPVAAVAEEPVAEAAPAVEVAEEPVAEAAPAVEVVEEPVAEAAVEAVPAEVTEEKPKPVRKKRVTKAKAEEPAAEAAVEAVPAEVTEEKPKPVRKKRVTKAKAEEPAAEAAVEAVPAEVTEEKPKPVRKKRATKAKAEEPKAEEAEEKPKPVRKKRVTKAKADETPAEAGND